MQVSCVTPPPASIATQGPRQHQEPFALRGRIAVADLPTRGRAEVQLQQDTTALWGLHQKRVHYAQLDFTARAPPPTSRRAAMCRQGTTAPLGPPQRQGWHVLQAFTALEAPATRLHARLASFLRGQPRHRRQIVRIVLPASIRLWWEPR
jgi:hypothetical protein